MHCGELAIRLQENVMCPGVRDGVYAPLMGCRCAPSSPCEKSCPIWCAGGDAGAMESSCDACTKALCSAQLAACNADK
jgi:hypothetical protein